MPFFLGDLEWKIFSVAFVVVFVGKAHESNLKNLIEPWN